MIKKQSKPLSKAEYLYGIVFCFLLAIAFYYTLFCNHHFYPYLLFSLVFVAVFLAAELIRWNDKRQRLMQQRNQLTQLIQEKEKQLQQQLIQHQSYKQDVERYQRLSEFIENIGKWNSLLKINEYIVSWLRQIFDPKQFQIIIYIFHGKADDLGFSTAHKEQLQINARCQKGDIFDEWMIKNMKPLFIEDLAVDARFEQGAYAKISLVGPIRSLVSLPLMMGDKALGILRIHSAQPSLLNLADQSFLADVGQIAAVAIESALLSEHLDDLAAKDSLTGLYLRKYFMSYLAEALKQAHLKQQEISFVMIDLDNFKSYNDTFGHMAGDIVLKTLAALLAQHFASAQHLVGRYGGEEFCVILNGCSKQEAIALAESFRVLIEKQVIVLRRQSTRITVSMGVAAFPEDAKDIESLIHRADQAMYQAKGLGKNRVCS